MGGDGMGAMAAGILAAMALLAVVPAALALWIGNRVARARGGGARRATMVRVAFGIAGLGIGMLAVTAVFFENVWAPPPTIRFATAAGSDPDWIVLLEDRQRGVPIDWQGTAMPFRGIDATIAVPPGGVVRVASLARLEASGDVRALWPDGAEATGHAAGPAPAGTGATGFVAWTRKPWEGPADDLPMDDALAYWLREREGAR